MSKRRKYKFTKSNKSTKKSEVIVYVDQQAVVTKIALLVNNAFYPISNGSSASDAKNLIIQHDEHLNLLKENNIKIYLDTIKTITPEIISTVKSNGDIRSIGNDIYKLLAILQKNSCNYFLNKFISLYANQIITHVITTKNIDSKFNELLEPLINITDNNNCKSQIIYSTIEHININNDGKLNFELLYKLQKLNYIKCSDFIIRYINNDFNNSINVIGTSSFFDHLEEIRIMDLLKIIKEIDCLNYLKISEGINQLLIYSIKQAADLTLFCKFLDSPALEQIKQTSFNDILETIVKHTFMKCCQIYEMEKDTPFIKKALKLIARIVEKDLWDSIEFIDDEINYDDVQDSLPVPAPPLPFTLAIGGGIPIPSAVIIDEKTFNNFKEFTISMIIVNPLVFGYISKQLQYLEKIIPNDVIHTIINFYPAELKDPSELQKHVDNNYIPMSFNKVEELGVTQDVNWDIDANYGDNTPQ
ncbi:MAG: hypothetical protein HRU35_00795 [Rickettsiaceae bacterium]|nr:hypothetical protein [Rickettsiaceae bacterium]